MEQVKQAENFRKVKWDGSTKVRVTTLDDLIREHGIPAFCKIDVEGFEAEVLKGLSQPLPCLSVEYLPADAGAARSCIRRIAALGDYEFNVSPIETMRLAWERWKPRGAVESFLEKQPRAGRSGDVYARLRPGAAPRGERGGG
jgi:hypothetical protein